MERVRHRICIVDASHDVIGVFRRGKRQGRPRSLSAHEVRVMPTVRDRVAPAKRSAMLIASERGTPGGVTPFWPTQEGGDAVVWFASVRAGVGQLCERRLDGDGPTLRRFTPGWEFVLSKKGMAVAYAGLALGLAVGASRMQR